jgi:hypothetical protein
MKKNLTQYFKVNDKTIQMTNFKAPREKKSPSILIFYIIFNNHWDANQTHKSVSNKIPPQKFNTKV